MNFKRKSTQLEGGEDDIVVSQLGEVEMKRSFNLLSLIALGFNTSNSWIAVASSLPLAIVSGGSVTLLYGILIAGAAMLSTGLSLAELASVYPTAGGQYHITSYMASKSHSRWISYICGLTGVFSWVAIAASVSFILTEFVISLAICYNPGFVPQQWHYFVIYQVFHLLVIGSNIYAVHRIVWAYDLAFFLSISLFVVVSIVCPVLSPARPATKDVWTNFVNSSNGWPDAIVFLTGLSTPSYMLIGLDATMHLAEECVDPSRFVPRAIMSTVICGIVTAFTFSVAMCYCSTNMASLLESPVPMTIVVLWQESTDSRACAVTFSIVIICIAFIALNAVHQTASRLTWSFASDDGIMLSNFIGKVDLHLKVPVYALVFNYIACFLIGILYLASSSAFNAFISTASILSQFSVSIPMAVLLCQKRSSQYLPASRSFRLPHIIGYVVNAVSVLWAITIMVFLCFPASRHITGGTMNYSAAVLAIMFCLGALNWAFHAQRHFRNPRLDS